MTEASTRHLVERLRDLERRTTPAPWEHDNTQLRSEQTAYETMYGPGGATAQSLFGSENSEAAVINAEYDEGAYFWDETAHNNFKFITAARNAMPELFTLIETLTRERDEARNAIAWANNSLFGSHGFFLSLDGGPASEHHLDMAIEDLKTDARLRHRAERQRDEAIAERDTFRAQSVELTADNFTLNTEIEKLTAERDALREALVKERDACAKIADNLGDSDKNDNLINDDLCFVAGYEIGCREVAAAIRARSLTREVGEAPSPTEDRET